MEAYPGVFARSLIGNRGYKNDTKKKPTAEQLEARREIFEAVTSGELEE